MRKLFLLGVAVMLVGCGSTPDYRSAWERKMETKWTPRVAHYTYAQTLAELGPPTSKELVDGSTYAAWKHKVPNPADMPVLEQQPGVPVPLTAPDSVTKNTTDGLYYKAGESEPYTGSTVLTHANGQRKFEGFFKNGFRDGPGVMWWPNGKKYKEGDFQDDKLYDGFVYWYYAGNPPLHGVPLALKMRGDYEKGRMVRGTHWDRLGAKYFTTRQETYFNQSLLVFGPDKVLKSAEFTEE